MSNTTDSSSIPTLPNIDPPVLDPSEAASQAASQASQTLSYNDLAPNGILSQTSISLEAYILGIIMASGIWLSILALYHSSTLWRPPLFLSILSLFHFAEFYTYARWNLKNLKAGSYLTLTNGRPYTIAMSFAFFETLVTSLFFTRWQSIWSPTWLQVIGLSFILIGQVIRDGAIATAGTSFNHSVQKQRRTDHLLITSGLYKYFRHPSYFGFYWWAIGGQILVGNVISTGAFAYILWRFFYNRSTYEERSLIRMFGDEYIRYRSTTSIGIPFMSSAIDSRLKHWNAIK